MTGALYYLVAGELSWDSLPAIFLDETHQKAQREVAAFLKMAEKRLNKDINKNDTQRIVKFSNT